MINELCPPDVPCRIGYWNIPVPVRVVFFVLIFLSVFFMVWGIAKRVQLWRKGQPALRFDRLPERIGRVLKYAVVQLKIIRQRYPAAMHLAIFWTMVLLFIGTALASLDTDIFELILNSKLLIGNAYLLYKTVLDLAGLFCLVGLGLATYRRYIIRSPRLNIDWRFNFTLPLLAFIILTGLVVEALRLAAETPPWAPFSVVAYPISLLLQGASESALIQAHLWLWNIHWVVVAVFFASLPWTNLYHIFSSPANIFFAPFRPKGALQPIADLEQAERLGANKLTDFSMSQLANLDACTECGRCQEVCPAYAANQPLNPKYIILNLRDYMSEGAPKLLGRSQIAAGTPTYAAKKLQHKPGANGPEPATAAKAATTATKAGQNGNGLAW